ncbi:DEKNAAC102053 [Brettanomyces naardenensis]|uniref:DEKNAAC102053 n=1 Tax=Brettanomyces naardenensis TaxID=13370 RepID=A0A448YJT4_BRENA|nr:DEKNAAC102053 [Brettanomyces naardenensis]
MQNDTMDTTVSELTAKMSSFQLDDDIYHLSPSKVRPHHHGHSNISRDFSDYSLMSRSTPLKLRLQSLNLNTTADFISRIPKRSPSVILREGNEENTPSKLPLSKNKLGQIKSSMSMSRLPLPTKRKLVTTPKKTNAIQSHKSHIHPPHPLLNTFVSNEFVVPQTPQTVSYLQPTEASLSRSAKKDHQSREPLEKKVKLSKSPYGFPRKTSIEKIREKRLAAIKETNESLGRRASEARPAAARGRQLVRQLQRPLHRQQFQRSTQHQRPSVLSPSQQHIDQYRRKSWRSPSNNKQGPWKNSTQLIQWDGKISTDSEIHSLLRGNRKLNKLFQVYIKASGSRNEPENPCDSSNIGSERPDLYENLSVYEKGEVLKDTEIYFTGRNKTDKVKADPKSFKTNFGFDDNDKYYRCVPGDHIQYRYEICQQMGKGTFGSVISARDHKSGRVVALKIVKNHMEWSLQAVNEVKFLKKFSELGSRNIIRYYDHFHFRSHMCIATELLSVNLFQLIEATKFKGFGLSLVRRFCVDILQGLKYIHDAGSIHCDMKPENLMLAFDSGKQRFYLKIIDFGSSCSTDQLAFSYLQSRYYRAPEVCLGARYNEKIDIWSFGAIVVELFVGMPIFQCQDEYALLDEFLNYFGPPPRDYIKQLRQELVDEGPIHGWGGQEESKINYNTLLWHGFNTDGFINLHYLLKRSPKRRFRASTKTVKQFLMRHADIDQHDTEKLLAIRDFSEFVERCFSWNREVRAGCGDLLEDRFLAN